MHPPPVMCRLENSCTSLQDFGPHCRPTSAGRKLQHLIKKFKHILIIFARKHALPLRVYGNSHHEQSKYRGTENHNAYPLSIQPGQHTIRFYVASKQCCGTTS